MIPRRRLNLTSEFAFHPLADVFPLLEGDQFDRLVEDIRANGLHEPIVMCESQILEGRNRARACQAAGKDRWRVEDYAGNDPAGYVISRNLRRRHLDASQRAIVGARMATLHWGQRADRVEGSIDLSAAAKRVDVSVPTSSVPAQCLRAAAKR
jgi:hypothetical protein